MLRAEIMFTDISACEYLLDNDSRTPSSSTGHAGRIIKNLFICGDADAMASAACSAPIMPGQTSPLPPEEDEADHWCWLAAYPAFSWF
jgi:hypothetical protein